METNLPASRFPFRPLRKGSWTEKPSSLTRGAGNRVVFSSWEGPSTKPNDKGFRKLIRLFVGIFVPQERQRFLPTASGYALILLAVGLCAAAYNTGSNILFVVLALLLSLFIFSGILSWMNFRQIRWRVESELPFRCAEKGTGWVRLENRKRFMPTSEIFFSVEAKDQGLEDKVLFSSPVLPGEEEAMRWAFVPRRRGLLEVTLSGAQSKYPFGFMRKMIGKPRVVKVAVWPQRIPCRVHQHPWSQKHLHGEASRHPGHGDDLIQIRRYEYGDPFHLVHWKASARTGKIMIRKMAGDEKEGLFFYLDPSNSLWRHEESFENLCRLAGSLGEKLFTAGQFRGYFGPSLQLKLIKKEEDVWHFLDLLSGFTRSDASLRADRMISRKNTLYFEPYGETGAQAVLTGRVFATS